MEEVMIQAAHVSMRFYRELNEANSVKERLVRMWKGERQVVEVKALNDVSFTIGKGEIVGIIGVNGSGKSTLLKLIAGVLPPTQGHLLVDHDKVQLLTLGTGFDHELTGRENIYLNGAISGYSRSFLDAHVDAILSFAQLQAAADAKVRTYSSGMVSRLAFAIATAGRAAEILILDEVLSVGDLFFRRKSEARIREMIRSGSTVLIVSHAPAVIRSLSTRVLWLRQGELIMDGPPDQVCTAYERIGKEMSG